jgi:hypothetical protein
MPGIVKAQLLEVEIERMGGLREPLSVRQVAFMLLLLAGAIAEGYWLGGAGFWRVSSLHMLDWVFSVFVFEFLVQPVTTLLHELGHAIAATRLGRRPALVIVGRGPWTSTKWGQVTIRFSLVPGRGIEHRGLCVYDPSGLPWRSIGWISLAGPIATAITLAAILAVAASTGLWAAGLLARYIIFWTVAMLALALIVNLIPRRRKPQAQAATVGARDGWVARQAFECHRKGLPPPSRRQAPSGAASASRPVPVRTVRSIPPPA